MVHIDESVTHHPTTTSHWLGDNQEEADPRPGKRVSMTTTNNVA